VPYFGTFYFLFANQSHIWEILVSKNRRFYDAHFTYSGLKPSPNISAQAGPSKERAHEILEFLSAGALSLVKAPPLPVKIVESQTYISKRRSAGANRRYEIQARLYSPAGQSGLPVLLLPPRRMNDLDIARPSHCAKSHHCGDLEILSGDQTFDWTGQ